MRTVLGALVIGASLGISASLAQADTIRLADSEMDTVTAAGASAMAKAPAAALKARDRVAELRKESRKRIAELRKEARDREKERRGKFKKDRKKADERAVRGKVTKRGDGAFAAAEGAKVSVSVSQGKGVARAAAFATAGKSMKK